MEKMTNKKALEFVLGLEVVVANEEVYQKLQKMLEQVEKKNGSAKGTLSPTQKQNEQIKLVIIDILKASEEPLQIKDLMEKDGLQGFSNQKLSALVRQLVADQLVTRIEEKKVARFTV